jgi:signal transduction histidine kinase
MRGSNTGPYSSGSTPRASNWPIHRWVTLRSVTQVDEAIAPRRGWPTAGWLVAIVAVALLALQSVGQRDLEDATDGRSIDALAALLLAGAASCAIAARRYPATGALATLAFSLTWYAVGYTSSLVNVPHLVAFYFLGASGDRRRQLAVGALAVAGATVGMIGEGGQSTASTASAIGWTVAAVLLGEVMWNRQALLAEYRARAARAEADREAEAARRVASVRLEIARDLHDVLAHSVALMTVQAGVGKDALERGSDGVGEALATIRSTGRDAMREVQALITVLRDGQQQHGAAPVPTLDRIPDLASAPRAAGIDVSVSVDVGQAEISDLAQLTAYRIVQEALTNVVRHACASRASISVAVDGHDLCVEVRDDGRGADVSAVPGYGLRGMRERAQSAGGTFQAGPGADRGWVVTARIPRRRTAQP